MQFLFFLQQALVWLLTIYWIYQLIISAYALVKLKEKPILTNKKNKFMLIVPAHNEEAVIRKFIREFVRRRLS